MTRRGARQTPWTTGEVAYLLEHAGVDSVRSICRHLKRSGESVRQMAKRLRKQGYDIDLHVYQGLTVICPKCGQARSKLGKWTSRTGICEVCRMRDAYQEALWRQGEAWGQLPAAARGVYDGTQAATGRSALPERPKQPMTMGLAPAQARRVQELHAIEVEKWELKCLKLLTDAAKQRTKRMREKSGTNPRKGRGAKQERERTGEQWK